MYYLIIFLWKLKIFVLYIIINCIYLLLATVIQCYCLNTSVLNLKLNVKEYDTWNTSLPPRLILSLVRQNPEEKMTVGAWCLHLFRDRLLSGDNEQLHLGNTNPGAQIFLSVCSRASPQWPIQAATLPLSGLRPPARLAILRSSLNQAGRKEPQDSFRYRCSKLQSVSSPSPAHCMTAIVMFAAFCLSLLMIILPPYKWLTYRSIVLSHITLSYLSLDLFEP